MRGPGQHQWSLLILQYYHIHTYVENKRTKFFADGCLRNAREVAMLMGKCTENAVFVARQRLNYAQGLANFDYNENSLIIIELSCAPNKT